VAKKKKPSQLQHLQLPQHLQLLLLMQRLPQLQQPLLLAPLLLQLQHQPVSNFLLQRKKPLQSGFFYIFILAYLISCSSSKVSSRYPAGVFSGLPASS
jgi:hypothetical protein